MFISLLLRQDEITCARPPSFARVVCCIFPTPSPVLCRVYYPWQAPSKPCFNSGYRLVVPGVLCGDLDGQALLFRPAISPFRYLAAANSCRIRCVTWMLVSASISKAGSTANSFAIGCHSHLPHQLDGHGESQRLVNVVKFPHD